MRILALSLATVALITPLTQQASKASPVSLYGSYDDCLAFQKQTKCTECIDDGTSTFPFNSDPTGANGIFYELVTCNFPGKCPDGVVKNTCSWQRYLVFECEDGSQVGFRVGTNSLPDHCYYAENNEPYGSSTDFNFYWFSGVFNLPYKSTVAYQVDVVAGGMSSSEFAITTLNEQTDIDTALCDGYWAKYQNLDAYHVYDEGQEDATQTASADWGLTNDTPLLRLPSSEQVVGVALNGVFLFSGTSEFGYDAFFPKAYGNKKSPKALEVDICLGTSHTSNTYRYHMFSPCIYDVGIKQTASPCNSAEFPGCQKDVREHALSYIPAQLQTKLPVGIAKDGRIIYGPFKTDGTLWQPCDVDVCNGRRDGNYYYYVSTMFHPYFVGCWGPGNSPSVSQSCSSNPRVCSGASGLLSTVFAFVALAAMVFSF